LVRCENGVEKNLEAINRVEYYLQIRQNGGNDELAFFPREIDTRAAEGNKRLKLCRSGSGKGLKGIRDIKYLA
jgi:hypothetical protein